MLDSPIEEIKSRLNVVDVVQDFVQLKKAGTNYKGLCPFHSEKSGSFMVSPTKQIWHCFGCGLGGDVFEFIKQIENIEFAEALKILADRAGVELKKPTFEQIQGDKKKDVLYEINTQAAKYFAKVLWESNAGAEALDYLRRRGLTDQTIKNWQLGYAPDDFHYLENFLAKGFDKRDIEQAGLIIKSDRDAGYFDRFHDRVMFPIINLHGQTVGFTGRLLHDKPNTGKYINSPETPIYNKSQVIYGLYAGKQSIRKGDRAILVEGNMDVIACHQVGFDQAVATSGTALTQDQLNILKRFTENLVFAFDTDAAGSTATKRALELALNSGFNVKIANLGTAKDPDELIKKGIGLWQKTVESAGNFLDFVLENLLKNNNPAEPEGIAKIESEIMPLINYVSNPVVKAHYVRKVAAKINVPEKALYERLASSKKPVIKPPSSPVGIKKDRRHILEENFLGLILITKQKHLLDDLTDEEFSPEHREIFQILKTDEIDADRLPKKYPQLKQQFDLLEFTATEEPDGAVQNPKQKLSEVVKSFTELIYKERLDRYQREYGTADPARKALLEAKINETIIKRSQLG